MSVEADLRSAPAISAEARLGTGCHAVRCDLRQVLEPKLIPKESLWLNLREETHCGPLQSSLRLESHPLCRTARPWHRRLNYPVALTHATVIDATGKPPLPDMTVVISGERIVAVGRSGDVAIPSGAKVLDLTGRYVIPGLCDMHVHSIPSERITPPLYVANGVTTVREMNGYALVHQWRDRIESGSMLGPRWVIGSRIIDGKPTIGDPASFTLVGNVTEARQAVREAKQEGDDFVKVYFRLSDDTYRAIAEEARLLKIPFAGHCPDAVPVTEASARGQRSIEHLYSTWYATSTREAEIYRRIADLTIDQSDYVNQVLGRRGHRRHRPRRSPPAVPARWRPAHGRCARNCRSPLR
jgi:hypothetical protein